MMIDEMKNLIITTGEIPLANWQTLFFINISTVIAALVLAGVLLAIQDHFQKDANRIKILHVLTIAFLMALISWLLFRSAPTGLKITWLRMPFVEMLLASIMAVAFVHFFMYRKVLAFTSIMSNDSLYLKLISLEISLGLFVCTPLATAGVKLISYKLNLYAVFAFPLLWFGFMLCFFDLAHLFNTKIIKVRMRLTAAIIRRLVTANNSYTVINLVIREYQNSVKDWKYQAVLYEFYTWVERFDSEFKLNIPMPVIAIACLKKRNLAEFRLGRNSLGIKYEIAITRNHAESTEFWRALGTVLHECLHLWQGIYGKPGRGIYHNREFRDKASSFGLNVDQRGCTQYAPENSPFFNIMAKYGVEVPSWCSVDKHKSTNEKPQIGALKLKLQKNRYTVRIKAAHTQLCTKCLTYGALSKKWSKQYIDQMCIKIEQIKGRI